MLGQPHLVGPWTRQGAGLSASLLDLLSSSEQPCQWVYRPRRWTSVVFGPQQSFTLSSVLGTILVLCSLVRRFCILF